MNTAMHPRPRVQIRLIWVALVVVEVSTQLALKRAGKQTGGFDFSIEAFAVALQCGWLWLAAAGYVAAFAAWMLILRDVDLSRAFPTSAIVFVAVMLASWLVLHESIGLLQGVGALLIVVGILDLGGGDAANAVAQPSTLVE